MHLLGVALASFGGFLMIFGFGFLLLMRTQYAKGQVKDSRRAHTRFGAVAAVGVALLVLAIVLLTVAS